MSPSAQRKGDQTAEMTDEQIIQALELSATLVELNAENEQRKKDKEKEELDKVVGGALKQPDPDPNPNPNPNANPTTP